jgi:hypothetical protein
VPLRGVPTSPRWADDIVAATTSASETPWRTLLRLLLPCPAILGWSIINLPLPFYQQLAATAPLLAVILRTCLPATACALRHPALQQLAAPSGAACDLVVGGLLQVGGPGAARQRCSPLAGSGRAACSALGRRRKASSCAAGPWRALVDAPPQTQRPPPPQVGRLLCGMDQSLQRFMCSSERSGLSLALFLTALLGLALPLTISYK